MKNLPQLIISYWILLFFVCATNWYKEYEQLIDNIDTLIVATSLIHYFFYYKIYPETSKYCIFGIVSVIFLHKIYFDFDLNNQTYYICYGLIMTIVLYFSIKANLNK